MSDEISTRRRGKIAQCPRHIRERIYAMLDDGKQGREVLAWANAQPEVVALVKEKFEGEPISDNNLSQWFKGGFLDWRAEQEEVEKTQKFAEFSLRLAGAAGGSVSEGAAAIAAGRIMTALESAEGETLINLVSSIGTLRGKEIDKAKLGLVEHRNRQRDEQLDLERQRFQRLAVGKFIDWVANEEARAIASGSASKEVKMDQLIELMFGKRPEADAA